MAEYGYAYISTYRTVRNEKREPVITKPFVPSLPKSNNGNKEGHVTRKTIVPINSSRPYDDSATEKYPSRSGGDDDDDNQWHRQTSPVRGSPRKQADHEFEANRPQRFRPVANSTGGWRHTPHEPTPYSSTAAEGRKPIATNNGTNGYGGPYYGGNKEGWKPHDCYNNGTNGYGSDYGGNKERAKPVASTVRNGDYGTNGYGGDYGGNKEGRKLQPNGISTIRKNDNHGGFNGTNNIGYAGDKGGRNKKDNYDHHEYDGTNNGYGGYSDDDHYCNNKEGYKPTSLPIRKNGGYNNNNGYGIGNGNNKEHSRPFGSSTTRNNNNYDDVNYNNRGGHRHNPNGPKISSDWTKAPRKGTQLSEPTHDIEKALELLKMEAAKREQSNANNKDDYEYEYDRPPSSTPIANWAAPAPGNGNGSRFADLITSKFDKGTGSPRSMPMEPASPNKGGNYGSETDDHDRKGDPLRTFANFNPSSRPRTPTIDSKEAEKMFNGTRV